MKFIHLTDRCLVKLCGSEVKQFLQGVITNDIERLEQALYTLMLSPQGRYLFDCFLVLIDEDIFLDCPQAQKVELIEKLKLYRIHHRVKIIDVSTLYQIFVVLEDGVLPKTAYQDPRTSLLGRRVFFKKDELPSNLQLGVFDQYENVRIKNLIPDHHDLIQNTSFPLEYRMDQLHALSFTKGCYTGQEVVARMLRSGAKKTVYRVSTNEQNIAKAGATVRANDEEIGIMRSGVDNIGIAWLRIEKVQQAIEKNWIFSTDDGQDLTIEILQPVLTD